MTLSLYERAMEAARFIDLHAGGRKFRAAIVLGSGLGGVAGAATDAVEISYDDIPNFVPARVDGHAGKLVIGSIGGVEVTIMKGRAHFYEGHSLEEVTLPIRVFALMGIRCLVLTNAAGSTAAQLEPGALMIITDHINLMGDNPLRGLNDERFGPRFPDMTNVYTPAYIEQAHEAARELGITIGEGVYGALRGPSYETPAEVRMLRDLGADALGMSTAPEATVARHCGMNVLAISCITNEAAGLGSAISHEDVMKIGDRAGRKLAELIVRVIPRLVNIETLS